VSITVRFLACHKLADKLLGGQTAGDVIPRTQEVARLGSGLGASVLPPFSRRPGLDLAQPCAFDYT